MRKKLLKNSRESRVCLIAVGFFRWRSEAEKVTLFFRRMEVLREINLFGRF